MTTAAFDKAVREAVRSHFSEVGRKGGKARVPKGFASLTQQERIEMGKKAAEARWRKKASDGSQQGTR